MAESANILVTALQSQQLIPAANGSPSIRTLLAWYMHDLCLMLWAYYPYVIRHEILQGWQLVSHAQQQSIHVDYSD